MAFRGPIDLKRPMLEVGLFEEYDENKQWGEKVREARRKVLGEETTGASEDGASEPSAPKLHKDKGKEKLIESGLIDENESLRSVWLARKVSQPGRRGFIRPGPPLLNSFPCARRFSDALHTDLRYVPPPDRCL